MLNSVFIYIFLTLQRKVSDTLISGLIIDAFLLLEN